MLWVGLRCTIMMTAALVALLLAEQRARTLDEVHVSAAGGQRELTSSGSNLSELAAAATAPGATLIIRLCPVLGSPQMLIRRLQYAGMHAVSPSPHTIVVNAADVLAGSVAEPVFEERVASATPPSAGRKRQSSSVEGHAKQQVGKSFVPQHVEEKFLPLLPSRAQLIWTAKSNEAANAAVRSVVEVLAARAAAQDSHAQPPRPMPSLDNLKCVELTAIPPTGELEGNCAYASMLRSSGSVFSRGGERETDACANLRRAVVAALACRLLTEPGFAGTVTAVGVASDGGKAGGSGSGGGSDLRRKGAAWGAFAAACSSLAPLSAEAAAAMRCLGRHLAVGRVVDADAYAGPLELTELSRLAARDIVLFTEPGAGDDGGVFCGGSGGGPPLIAILTRRRHTRPVRVSLALRGDDAVPLRASELADASIRNFANALQAAETVAAKDAAVRSEPLTNASLAAARALLSCLEQNS